MIRSQVIDAAKPRAREAQARALLTVINDRPYFDRHRRHVAEAAARAGWRSCVAMPKDPQSTREEQLELFPVPFKAGQISPLQDLKALSGLMSVLGRVRPCLVHAITLKAIILTSVALRLHQMRTGEILPLVATFPGLGYAFKRFETPSLAQRVRRLIATWGCGVACAWPNFHATFETEEDSRFLANMCRIPKAKTFVMQGTGLDLSVFSPRAKPAGAFTVLFAGRLLKSKGIMEFIDAARQPGAASFRWLIAGWPYDSPDALSEAEIDALKREPSVRFLGAVSDMPALLANTHALVLPSSYPEGIPRILIEAAATATPMISTEFAGSRALVQHGVTGLVLSDGSSEAIFAAVSELASMPDRGEALGLRARAAVETGGFGHSDVQKAFLDIYEKALCGMC